MRSQHRAPLVAYALVAIAGLVVILQTLSPQALSLHRVPQTLLGAGDFQVADPVAPVVPQPIKPTAKPGSPSATGPGLGVGVGTTPGADTSTASQPGRDGQAGAASRPGRDKGAQSVAPQPAGTEPQPVGTEPGGTEPVGTEPEPGGDDTPPGTGPSAPAGPHYLIPPIGEIPGVPVPAIWPLVPPDEQKPLSQAVPDLVESLLPSAGDKQGSQDTGVRAGQKTSVQALTKSDADDQGAGETTKAENDVDSVKSSDAQAGSGEKVPVAPSGAATKSASADEPADEPGEESKSQVEAPASEECATAGAAPTEAQAEPGAAEDLLPTLSNVLKAVGGSTDVAPGDEADDDATTPCTDPCAVIGSTAGGHGKPGHHAGSGAATKSSAPTDPPSATLAPQTCASAPAAHEDHSTAKSHHARK